jgi:hypothetical protein
MRIESLDPRKSDLESKAPNCAYPGYRTRGVLRLRYKLFNKIRGRA